MIRTVVGVLLNVTLPTLKAAETTFLFDKRRLYRVGAFDCVIITEKFWKKTGNFSLIICLIYTFVECDSFQEKRSGHVLEDCFGNLKTCNVEVRSCFF